ncbi:MAG TPA: tetratricopeptide repeat protein [Cyclobacteriaceae bacterium]|nr:tetratricopeptide repeat protein [Cyclobacteriaceae bacterium]
MRILIRLFGKYLLLSSFFVITLFNFAFAQNDNARIDSLQAVLRTIPEDTNKVNTLIELCRAQPSSDLKLILQFANEALALSQKINFPAGEAHTYFYLGYSYYAIGDMPKALESILKALSIYEKIGNTNEIGYSYNAIGLIYKSQDETKDALTFFERARSTWSKHGFKEGIALALSNLGSIYEIEQKDSLALDHYERSLKLSKEIDNKPGISNTLNAIGSIYLKKKEFTKSFEYQKEALRYAIESDNPIAQIWAYNAMSQIHLAQNQPGEGLRMAQSALKIAQRITSKVDLVDSYNQVYKSYEKLKDYPKAFEFISLYMSLNDSLKNSEDLSSMEKLKSRYELDKKESEIALLTQRHQVEIFRRNVVVITLIALLTIGFLLYNRYRLITQRKLDLKIQQLTLYTQSLVEKSEALSRVNLELEQFKSNSSNEDVHIAKIDRILQSNILTNEDWDNFKKAFEDIYPAFFSKLRYKYPDITAAELRLSALIKLNLSTKEIASMLGVLPESVKTSRYRLKKKFGLAEDESAEDFIKNLELPSIVVTSSLDKSKV